MTIDELYGLAPEEMLKVNLAELSPQDLSELAYYLWCCYEDDEEVQKWRSEIILPMIKVSTEASVPEEDLDHG